MKHLLAAISICVFVGQAQAADNDMSANKLSPSCRLAVSIATMSITDASAHDRADYLQAGNCGGYVIGLAAAWGGLSEGRRPFCIPAAATQAQVITVVVRYADLHPQETRLPMATIV